MLSASNYTLTPAPPAAPRLPLSWCVRYALNFPTGEPILTHLYYDAPNGAAALRSFNYDMNRARLVASFRCSVHVLAVHPTGALND